MTLICSQDIASRFVEPTDTYGGLLQTRTDDSIHYSRKIWRLCWEDQKVTKWKQGVCGVDFHPFGCSHFPVLITRSLLTCTYSFTQVATVHSHHIHAPAQSPKHHPSITQTPLIFIQAIPLNVSPIPWCCGRRIYPLSPAPVSSYLTVIWSLGSYVRIYWDPIPPKMATQRQVRRIPMSTGLGRKLIAPVWRQVSVAFAISPSWKAMLCSFGLYVLGKAGRSAAGTPLVVFFL